MIKNNNIAKLNELIKMIREQEAYLPKIQLAGHLVNIIKKKKRSIPGEVAENIKAFAMNEITKYYEVVKSCTSYKKRSMMFDYLENIIEIIVIYHPNPQTIEEDKLEIIRDIVRLTQMSRYFEYAVNAAFEQESVDEDEAEHICDMASKMTDEYQRGLIFKGLIYYRGQLDKLTPDAKNVFAVYIEKEIEQYLSKQSLTEDEKDNLIFAADISCYLPGKKTEELMRKAFCSDDNCLKYTAASSIIELGGTVTAQDIEPIANDLTYADMMYSKLEKHSLTTLFPKHLTDPVYLAKSNLVHWLTYPTELDKEPDEIEYIGCAKVKKEMYYIFKYRSDSKCLSQDCKNKWLIGWSSKDGGTFSTFDLYENFEDKTPEKTVKKIVKKLIK